MHPRSIAVAAGLLALAVTPGCGDGKKAGGPPQMPPPGVTVAQPLQRAETEWAESTGRLWAVEYADVRARVSGLVERVAFVEGMPVKAGDVLFEIDQRPFAVALQAAEARAADARARLSLARSEVERASGLIEKGGISRELFDQRQSQAAIAAATLQSAEAAVAAAKLDMGYTRVVAPIAGRAGRALVKAGNLVSPAGEPLVAIIASDPIHVFFDLDERTWAQARALYAAGGANPPVRVGVEGEAGHPREAKLDFVDNRVDPSTGTIRLRATLPNADGALMPGGFARVRIPLSLPEPRLLIAERAIMSDQARKFVLVLGDKDAATYRPVTLGQAVGDLRIVREGLAPGDLVIVNGLARVFPGQPVAPQRGEMGAPEQPPGAPGHQQEPEQQKPAQAEPAPPKPAAPAAQAEPAPPAPVHPTPAQAAEPPAPQAPAAPAQTPAPGNAR